MGPTGNGSSVLRHCLGPIFFSKYQCIDGICAFAYSDYFYLNFVTKVQWSSPQADAVVDATLTPSITVNWSPVASIGSVSATLYLMHYAPIFNLEVSSKTVNMQDGSATLFANDGSMLPMFFQISYNCFAWGLLCSTERGPLFHVPSHYSAPVNYNGQGATKPYSLWKANCSDCTPLSTGMFCGMCNKCYVISASLDCTDCYTTNNVMVSNLRLDIGWFRVTHMSFKMSGVSSANLVLQFQASVDYQKSGEIALIPETLIPGTGWRFGSVLGFEFSVGFLVDMKATYALTASTRVRAVISARSTISYSYEGRYGADVTSLSELSGDFVNYTGGVTTMEGSGNVELTLGLRPSLICSLSPLAKAWAGFEPQIKGLPSNTLRMLPLLPTDTGAKLSRACIFSQKRVSRRI